MSVVALAGRRVDAPDAEVSRFASTDVDLVADRLERALRDANAGLVVASAAAGADLLALRAAAGLGARRIVVLPFERDRFERTSVADRPGSWEELFRDALATATVETLAGPFDDEDAAYAAATEEILKRALALGGADTIALVVWDGTPRGDGDHTARFDRRARELGIRTVEISTRP